MREYFDSAWRVYRRRPPPPPPPPPPPLLPRLAPLPPPPGTRCGKAGVRPPPRALTPAQVYGKEARRPKRVILGELIAGGDPTRLWFVEDRIRTLEDVKREPLLDGAGLFLAGWGYTTREDRAAARHDDRIVLLSLDRFCRAFPRWRAED